MVTATLPDLNTLTLDALKALIVAQHERLLGTLIDKDGRFHFWTGVFDWLRLVGRSSRT
jgi:hypothetical protein